MNAPRTSPFVLRGRVVVDAQHIHDDAAVAVEGASIAYVGAVDSLPDRFRDLERTQVPLITPGLVDAHTHAAWVGSRHDEYALKLAGAGYEEIARAGGGIASSMRAIEVATVDDIVEALRARLRRMASLGVTTVEVKSGYGLRPELELRQLEAIAEVARDERLPRVVPTFLALHALPPESRGEASLRARFLERSLQLVDEVADRKLAAFVDAYVDRSAFSVDEARPHLRRARERGFGVRLHVGQFADVGGAELAAELGAASADHLEVVSRAGLDAMARAGVAATLLPTAAFVLAQSAPDVAAMRAAGVKLIVASDANPGTSPSESLPLAMAFAARSYRMTLAEILDGVTHVAASSLGFDGLGRLVEGAPADLVAWSLPHEAALIQPWGVAKTLGVWRAGRRIDG